MNKNLLFLSIVLLLSGFSSLGYELAWIRLLSTGLGHEYIASLAVVAAFFFGLGLGALVTDRPVSRSRQPAMWYAGFELVIGIWAIVLTFVMPRLSEWLPQLLGVSTSFGRQWAVAFFVPMITLLPATMAMGGTLTALDRIYIRRHNTAWSVGKVYSLNTLGAAMGIIVSVFVMVPQVGYEVSLRLLALINIACATLLFFSRTSKKPSENVFEKVAIAAIPRQRLLVILFFTGFLGIGFEVLAVRALSQAMAGTVYTLSSVLAVYLMGNAIGAALYQRLGVRIDVGNRLSLLMVLMSLATILSVLGMSHIIEVHRWLLAKAASMPWPWLFADLMTAAVVLSLPTVAMGALFTHLAQEVRNAAGGLGLAVGVNTIGGALAPFVVGVGVLPLLGMKLALLMIPLAYLLIVPGSVVKQRRYLAMALVLLISIGGYRTDFVLVSLTEGDEILAHEDGVMATVSVVKDTHDEVHLNVDNHYQMGGTGSYFTDRRQTHIPMLLHPNPRRALFLGVGTGTTIAAAGDYEGLKAVGVELVPELIPLMHHFEKSTGGLDTAKWLKIHVADARRFIMADTSHYDVIIADLFHPARDGAASLYTQEHFKKIRMRLNEGGIFCQWLPLFQLDIATLNTIMRTYLSVFPTTRMFMNHYGVDTPMLALVSVGEQERFDVDWFEKRVNEKLREALTPLRLTDSYALFGTFMADEKTLKEVMGTGPINTDNNPQVMFLAPSALTQSASPGARLLALLNKMSPRAEDIVDTRLTADGASMASRLKAYWAARDQYIAIGVDMPQTQDPWQLLQTAGTPLLQTVYLSRDFAPAYNPLLGIAARIGRSHPHQAAKLLTALQQANPYRPEASHLLKALSTQGNQSAGY